MNVFGSKKGMAKTLCKLLALQLLCFNVWGGDLMTLNAESVSGNDMSVSVSDNDAEQNVDVSGNVLLPEEAVSGNDQLSALSVSGNAVLFAAPAQTGAKLALSGKTTDTITVDGDLSEGVWENAEGNEVSFLADFTISNNATVFKSVWNEHTLYIGVDVTDSAVVTADKGVVDNDVIYNNDGVEIFLDGDRIFDDHKSKPGQDAWDENDALNFADIPGATIKFATLSDYEGFYLAMLIENAGEAAPMAEVILSGNNKRSGGIETYDSVLQYYPTGDEGWKQLNTAKGAKPKNAKYNLGNGSFGY